MSRTVIPQRRRSWRAAPATDSLSAERWDLLEAAGSGEAQAIGQVCDRHGGALFGLALAILGDPARAEAVVVDVIAQACADPGATEAGGGGRSLRRQLAVLTYLYSTRCIADTEVPLRGSAMARMAELSALARRQRSAVALVQCGDHTVGDVADLLGLPVTAVAVLLSSGLRDLEAADRRAVYGGRQRPFRTGPPA